MNPFLRTQVGRRDFLRGGLAAMGGIAVAPGVFASGVRRADEPTLVVIQLAGGNDGLNTLVPIEGDAYYAARPKLSIPKANALKIDDQHGFHPKLRGLRKLWDRGELAIVEGVGYPNPNRSHFSSFDIWHAADPRGQTGPGGWLARLTSALSNGEPDVIDAVHVGERLPYSLYSGDLSGICFNDPSLYRWDKNEAPIVDAAGAMGERPSPVLSRIRRTFQEAQDSSARIREAAARYTTKTPYPDSTLGHQLHVCAALIREGLGARILSVELAGFDTHAKQAPMHEYLLETWDAALTAFLDDLRGTPDGARTVVMSFSEFGRRVAENASGGTDHGTAGLMFLAGPAVAGGLHGAPSSVSELEDGDLVFTTDFRSVYASVIDGWFGVDADALLGQAFPRLPLFA